MKQLTLKCFVPAAILTAVLVSSACHKKAAEATPPPPPPPPPPAPTATLAANPAVIEQGQSTTLTWETNNATDVNIDGIGTVMAAGSRTISPGSSTTYTLTAKGPGGSQDASTRVTVNARVAEAPPVVSDEDLFAQNVKDVLFDYDKYEIRADQAMNAQSDAQFLAQHPSIKIVVEGHCDDRGSEEYNLALGTHRAESLKHSLMQEGVSEERIKTVSYGKEKPFCTEDNEGCWQRNRVDHFGFAR